MLRLATLAVAISLVLAPGAGAITIDNFEEGDFLVTDDALDSVPTFAEQTVSPSNVVGGVRRVGVLSLGSSGNTAISSLTTNPLTDDSATLNSDNNGQLRLVYDGLANGAGDGSDGLLFLDLSGVFSIDITAAVLPSIFPPPPFAGAKVQLFAWDGTDFDITAQLPLNDGLTQIPLSLLPDVDLSDIRSLRLDFVGIGPDLQQSGGIAIDLISTTPIPEPGTALLLGLGLGGLALRRRAPRPS